MKGQWSIGGVFGSAFAKNQLESNISELHNFNGEISTKELFEKRTIWTTIKSQTRQYGISVNYQKNKHYFTTEFTGIRLLQQYSYNYKKAPNNETFVTGGIESKFFTRLNFQYGYGILQTKNKKFTLIPNFAIGIMPYKNNQGATDISIFNDDTSARVVKSYNNRGLNTHITIGLSAKFYINPRFDVLANFSYSHGFADKFRYTYMKNFPGKGTLFFDVINKARFYNANITVLYKLKKEDKGTANKKERKGIWSVGIVQGFTKAVNGLDHNLNSLPNVDGIFTKFNKEKKISRENIYSQRGISLNYQLKKHLFSFEYSISNVTAYYDFNSKYKGTDSSFSSYMGFIIYKRYLLQYGYAVLESKSKRISLIPTFGIGILPYQKVFASVDYIPNFQSCIFNYKGDIKYPSGLNTSFVFGISSKLRINKRFDLQGNITYNLGFSEQYRESFQKSYGTDGTLYFDVYNKARYYNANLVLLYKIKKEKPSEKSSENPFDLKQ